MTEKKKISRLLLSRMQFISPYVERDGQMKFTAAAIMNWMFKKQDYQPERHILPVTERCFHFQDVLVHSCLVPAAF